MLRKKDEEKIFTDLKILVKNKLKSGFVNRKGQYVDSVENVQLWSYEIDEGNEDRDTVIFLSVEAEARVFVIFSKDAKSSDDIRLKNEKPIIFNYKKELDNFEVDEETVRFYDCTEAF